MWLGRRRCHHMQMLRHMLRFMSPTAAECPMQIVCMFCCATVQHASAAAVTVTHVHCSIMQGFWACPFMALVAATLHVGVHSFQICRGSAGYVMLLCPVTLHCLSTCAWLMYAV